MKNHFKVSIFLLYLFIQSTLVFSQDRDKLTVLGEEIPNPYTIENVTKAYLELHPESELKVVPTTDRYIKFSPNTYEELARLDQLDVPLFDFPLGREIKELGDYYIAPGKEEEEIPDYYALVKTNTEIPEVPHDVLAEMHITLEDTKLTAIAYELVGMAYGGEAREVNGLDLSVVCDDQDLRWPECQCDFYLEHGDQQGYDACIEEVTAPPPPPPPPPTNDCECIFYDHAKKPAGRLSVEDSQLGDQGVKNVTIVVLGMGWNLGVTNTNANGCWRINSKFHSPAIAVIAIFKSFRVTVRAIRGVRIWQYAQAVKFNSTVLGSNFNNICQTFRPNSDDETREKMLWYSAHANNSVYDFDTYATQDNIDAPPNRLVVLLSNQETEASAPMLNHLKTNHGVQITLASVTAPGFGPILFDLVTDNFFSFINKITPYLQPLKLYLIAFAPDVYYGYGSQNNSPTRDSDEVNEVFLHEYGHAAQYKGLPNRNIYWMKEIKHVVENSGYGDGLAPESERAAIVESWAGFIGFQYADRKYGLLHSNGGVAAETRFIYQPLGGEMHTPSPPVAGNTSNLDWMPFGLFSDCLDNTLHNVSPLIDPVMDNIQGYTIKDCFDAVTTNNPDRLNIVEQNLTNILPSGQNINDLQLLFQQYGY